MTDESVREVRLERLHPEEVRTAMAQAPVAWLPLGALEFHAEHLPFGTDGYSAQHVVERAARIAGGVVLPWSWLTMGTLHLPWSFRYDAALVEATLRQTIGQLADHGARVVVVHTGHGPLDLAHLIKRLCTEVEADRAEPGFRAYGLCYLELNAALGEGLGTEWPVAIDHGSIVETSWVMAMEPDLVHLERLPPDPESASIPGVYGPDPRGRAHRELGGRQLDACASLLAERTARLLAGGRLDQLADLRTFVERYWPEPLDLAGRAGGPGDGAILLSNPAPVSRYLTAFEVELDGDTLEPEAVHLRNPTPGEAAEPVPAASLGPEAGFYVRRGQSAEARLPMLVSPGPHRLRLVLGLAGVASGVIDQEVTFA